MTAGQVFHCVEQDMNRGNGTSSDLNALGRVIFEKGARPVAYRMNGPMAAALAANVFRGAAAMGGVNMGGVNVDRYIDPASGVPVKIVIDQDLAPGVVEADAEDGTE